MAQVGAIATQAEANVAWKFVALAHLDDGATAEVALARLVEEDDKPEHRQAGIVDSDGNAATHTGAECYDWAGGVTGPGYAIQGNILVGPEVVEAMELVLAGLRRPADRAPAARGARAGDEAGGDRRGRQSAALLVVREDAGYGAGDDVAVDLRVDDHPAPVAELARLLDLNDLYLTASTEDEKVAVTPELDAEIAGLVQAQGHPRPALVGGQRELRDARRRRRLLDRPAGAGDPARRPRRTAPAWSPPR